MIGLCAGDIVFSIVNILFPFFTPATTSRRLYAVGNNATCSAMGFFLIVSTASYWYQGFLSIYFVLKVNWRMTDSQFLKYEKWMHLMAVLYPLGFAVVGLPLHAYGEYDMGVGCAAHGSDESELVSMFALGLSNFIIFVTLTINNIMIYWHVRKTLKKSDTWQ